MKKLFFYVLFSITYLGSFAQSAGPIEKYVGEYYQYMNTLNAPKPDIEVLNEIINRVNIKTGERFIIDEVVSTPGKSKDELFDISIQYLVDVFKDSKSVIQMQDKESGIIVVKGNTRGIVQFNEFILGKYTYEETVSFTLKIQFKDGRYRYEIYNIICKEEYYPESPIEIYLIPSFYNKGNKPTNKYPIESSSKRYINIRSQLLITELHSLFSLKNELNKFIFANSDKNNNDW